MGWISVDDELPENGEFVLGMRADGWWGRVQWTKSYGWRDENGCAQPVVKWCRVRA